MPALARANTAALALAACLASAACTATGSAPSQSLRAPTSSPAAPTSAPPSPTARVTAPPATLAPGVLRMLDIVPRPSGIVTDGTLIWAEDHAATSSVYAIDPNTGEIVATIDVSRPCDVVVLDDRIWVADLDAGKLVWIDREARTIGGEVAGLRGPCGLLAIDGSLWFAVDEGIARVDPETGAAVITTLDGGGAFPAPGLPLWAASYSTGKLLRIDPGSVKVVQTVFHPDGWTEGPALAVGFDSVWVGAAARHTYRVDPATGAVQARIETSQPTRLLATASGIWLTSYSGGAVERIDPTTNSVVFRAHLGGSINGITEGLGGIWVSDTANGRLYLIDPEATGIAP